MRTQLMIALKVFIVMTLLTGLLYPLCLTGIAQSCFPAKADGSLLKKNGQIAGSKWIGQPVDSNRYFWPRPSAVNYRTMPSGASNLAITSRILRLQLEKRKNDFLTLNGLPANTEVPSEMLQASGSGLDPHISVEAARLQTRRIAANRKLTGRQTRQLLGLIDQVKESRQFGLLGEPRINVFVLNLEMDQLFKTK